MHQLLSHIPYVASALELQTLSRYLLQLDTALSCSNFLDGHFIVPFSRIENQALCNTMNGMSNSYKAKQMIVMRRDLHMRKGKIAAQASHACVEATLMALSRYGLLDRVQVTGQRIDIVAGRAKKRFGKGGRTSNGEALEAWFNEGIAKVCVYVDSEKELLDIAEKGREKGFLVALIKDAGLTEFSNQPTLTCLAFEPLFANQIDPITGDLPLY